MPLATHTLAFAYDPARPVLRDLSLSLAPARVTALVGPNGAGKSTLLRLLLGLLTPKQGSVTLDDTPVHDLPPPVRARRLAYVPQRPDAAFGFSVAQTVAFGRHGSRPDHASVARALTAVELADRARDPFSSLSIGQQQRAALARALAQLDRPPERQGDADEPRYLIADEPVSAMDPRHALAALGLLQRLAHDSAIGIVVVLHDLTAARAIADDAILLDDSGRLVAQGPAPEVLTPATLAPIFGVQFRELTAPDLPAPALIPVHRTP